MISERQLEWLKNDLAQVPEDRLIVLNAHIPFVTFTDATAKKHQTDNLADLYEIVGDRPALGLSGHTHTTEQILPGEFFEGWQEATGTGPAPFHQIVTGGLSGSWWSGDLNDQGIPHGTQRLGSPRGYYQITFDGASYVDTYHTFGDGPERQMHASFSTPRFRDWAEKLFAFADSYDPPVDVIPPVTINDLGDPMMLTLEDLAEGSWVAINVWNGSKASTVSVSINGQAAIQATRTQTGQGRGGPERPRAHRPAGARQTVDARAQHLPQRLGRRRDRGLADLEGLRVERCRGPVPGLDADPRVQPPLARRPAGEPAHRRACARSHHHRPLWPHLLGEADLRGCRRVARAQLALRQGLLIAA